MGYSWVPSRGLGAMNTIKIIGKTIVPGVIIGKIIGKIIAYNSVIMCFNVS